MSANVWFEEVDTALIQEIQNSIKHKDNNGIEVPIQNIIVRKPEEDFKIEVFPCVSIYNTSYNFDAFRYNPFPKQLEKDIVNKTVELEDSAVPFNLDYQIDFWARYQTDINDMTRTWFLKHFRQFNLDVVDDGGTKRSCNCLRKGNITKSDLIQNKERLFHSIIKYSIWVELDNENHYNKAIVINREFNTKNGGLK